MSFTHFHTRILQQAFEQVLGEGTLGSVAFARCLDKDVIHHLTTDEIFQPRGWNVYQVANFNDLQKRSITADRAVEMREMKKKAVLFLVDTTSCGAGMDGIYSAAQEVNEVNLFSKAILLASREIEKNLSDQDLIFAKKAIKKAQGYGNRHSISRWTELDFLCRILSDGFHPGAYLHLLGLWPVKKMENSDISDDLKYSRMFVDRLLNSLVVSQSAERRVESLMLHSASDQQIQDLTRFLRSTGRKKLLPALKQLVGKEHLWVNSLKVEGGSIEKIQMLPWRKKNGGLYKWSGLKENTARNEPPELILNSAGEVKSNYVEIRWKTKPVNLGNKSEEYSIAIVTAQNEELALREVMHSSSRTNQFCRFSSGDFSDLGDDAIISAKAVVSVVGKVEINSQETEEFIIRFGDLEPTSPNRRGSKEVRAFSEALIELENWAIASNFSCDEERWNNIVSSKGYVSLHVSELGKSFKVLQPTLVRKIEEQWIESNGAIGRWRLKVRDSGIPTHSPEFIQFDSIGSENDRSNWGRLNSACRQMANRLNKFGGSYAQIYDEKSKNFKVVKEYILAWVNEFECSIPQLALANTIEIQSFSGHTKGLIVLPTHPLLVAWHTAYDNLVFFEAFDKGISPKNILNEFLSFDGAMFPSMLPGIDTGTSFVFADTLGFHTVGMVLDYDKEPKAAVSILHRALCGEDSTDSQPKVEEHSASILGKEVLKYLNCHYQPPKLHIHALRAGDGMTMARSLGRVRKKLRNDSDQDLYDNDGQTTQSSYVLAFYPSSEQHRVAGSFITAAREKRRSGAGSLLKKDQWMLETLYLPGDISLPELSWALKTDEFPSSSAHLSVAFNTFESRVIAKENSSAQEVRPLYAFGLISFFQREYTHTPEHRWQSFTSCDSEGEKHPSNRIHSERLTKLQRCLQRLVAKNLDSEKKYPTLITEISSEREESLEKLHRISDWVITIDRNAGIEYFDSPNHNPEIYDTYVIDCIPEREDLGCLQMITSTGNIDEVRNLLDGTLQQMGLSCSRKNATFVLNELKALSGKLAIRLTGHRIPSAELIALSASHAHCREASEINECWVSLKNGFLVPVDDIRDLSPKFSIQNTETERPDFIYVTATERTRLRFRFIEVKYRKHLRMAHAANTRIKICSQLNSWHDDWFEFYGNENITPSFRALRRAKLARTLMFYVKKAYRHNLSEERYKAIVSEINRMLKIGEKYNLTETPEGNRGWIFCPEFNLGKPEEIYSDDGNTRIFIFGPSVLPDSDFPPESVEPKTEADPQVVESNHTRYNNGNRHFSDNVSVPLNSVPEVCFGNDIYTNSEVNWSVPIKGNPHLLVAGLPGMGKTTCLLNLCTQLKENDINPVVFSFHEDLDEKLDNRFDSIRLIDFGGLGFNPLEITDRNFQKAYLDTAGALRDIFAAIFPNLGDIQLATIRNAIKGSYEEFGWKNPTVPSENLKEPPFRRFVEILRSESKPDAGLKKLLVRLDELDDYGFFDVSETYENLWAEKSPVVIRIHRTQNDNLQRAFATFVLYSLYKDMFRRGIQTRITHAVILDEAHRAAKLNLIPTMAKECRKYGISFVLASQEAKDFQSSIYSAIANYLVLRLTEADAKSLVKNVASSHQERKFVDKVKQMDKFRALYFREGEQKPSFVALRPLMKNSE